MSDFWNELFEKIDEQPYMDNRARKAEVIAEKKAKKLYSKLIDEATNEEELTEVWYLIAPELDKIAKEIAENLVVREWKPISDYLRKQLFGEQTDLRKVLAQFTAETELGNLKVKLIEGAPMGSLEYDGDEAVWFVTVMEGDRYVANVPFVSDDGKKPDEAQMLYDQLNNNKLDNWPDPVKQKVQDSAFGGVNYIERREGEKVEISEQ